MACNCEGKQYNVSMGCCEPVLAPIQNYYTKYQIDKMIEEIESGITSGCCITPEEVDEKIASAKTEIENEIPSLSGYATEQWVLDKHYISGVDLSDYALKSEIPTVPTSNTAFTNDAGYITDVACGYDSEAQDPAFVVGYEKDGEYVFGDYSELFRVGEGLKVTAEGALLENHRLSVNTTSAVTSGSTQIPTSDAVYRAISGFATNIELIQYITNLQNQIDSLRAEISGCCGSTGETITRWITMTGASDYTCSGTTKMTKEKEQQSTDGGNTWSDTGNYRSGSTVLEENSADCGYVPPIPTSFKYKLTLDNSSVVSAECDSTSAITHDELSSYSATCVSAEVGECVNELHTDNYTTCGAFCSYRKLSSVTLSDSVTVIGNYSFTNCSGLTSIDIPDSVTTIGDSAFYRCSGMTSANIGSGVTFIDHFAFAHCTALTSITIEAIIPPTLANYVFDDTNDCPIYVPAASVETYKTETNWSQYASRIQAIQ